MHFDARARIAGGNALGEFRELLHRRDNALPSRHARNAAMPSASNTASITEPLAPLGSDAEVEDGYTSGFFAGADRPSPSTTNSTRPFTRTSVQIVELNRDFMTSSKTLLRARAARCSGPRKIIVKLKCTAPEKPRATVRKSMTRASRSSCRSMPMQCGTFSGACSQQILGSDRIGADDFVRRDADAHIVVRPVAAQGSDDHVLRQQARDDGLR